MIEKWLFAASFKLPLIPFRTAANMHFSGAILFSGNLERSTPANLAVRRSASELVETPNPGALEQWFRFASQPVLSAFCLARSLAAGERFE